MNQFRLAKRRAEVSIGESVSIVRELQGFSQNKPSQLSAIPQATLSAIEHDRVRFGRRTRQDSGPRTSLPYCRPGFPREGVIPLKLRPNLTAVSVRFVVNLLRHDDSNRSDGRSPVRSPA
jgi:hypothetical protein